MAVFELPPSESLSSHVRTESRYGTLSAAAFAAFPAGAELACANAAITLPSVVKLLLIKAPSFVHIETRQNVSSVSSEKG